MIYESRTCRHCRAELPQSRDYFNFMDDRHGGIDGLDYICRPCRTERRKTVRTHKARAIPIPAWVHPA